MSIDWITVAGIGANVAVAGATLRLVWLGAQGLKGWRDEIKGREQFDLVQQIALLTYEFQERLDYARHGVSPYGITDPDIVRVVLDITRERVEALEETYGKLQVTEWQASITFGDDKTLFGSINSIFMRFRLAKAALLDMFEYQDPKTDPEVLKSDEAILYGTYDDDFGKAAHKAVEDLMEQLKKIRDRPI